MGEGDAPFIYVLFGPDDGSCDPLMLNTKCDLRLIEAAIQAGVPAAIEKYSRRADDENRNTLFAVQKQLAHHTEIAKDGWVDMFNTARTESKVHRNIADGHTTPLPSPLASFISPQMKTDRVTSSFRPSSSKQGVERQ